MNNKVSVIIPAYNCEALVEQAVKSILSQTHQNLEVLIADDGSQDNTKTIIDALVDSRITRAHNTSNRGYLATVNHLLSQATGDYICFQDADDWSAPDRIERQLLALSSRSLDACGTGIHYTTLHGKLLDRVIYPQDMATVRESMMAGLPSACYASILFSAQVLRETGGYRSFFSSGAEDVDWLLRLTEKFRFENLAEPLYFYRFSPTSITQSTNVLRLKASLQTARQLALQRQSGNADDLDTKRESEVIKQWNLIYERLKAPPLAEELHKINMLLRRGARRESLTLCADILRKDAPYRNKALVLSSVLLKVIIGMNGYQKVKRLFQSNDRR